MSDSISPASGAAGRVAGCRCRISSSKTVGEMDFPVFHLDWLGNRMLIGAIAVLHVFVNHPMAVGAMPFITLMEWWGYRTGEPKWDRLAYRLLAVCFIVTTSVGALTGVGIWLSASLVNPAAIGTLIRVFFWVWFSEWIVFVAEVSLILAYFLTWKSWGPEGKRLHIGVGAALSVCSWLTMAIVVAILGFMMDSGTWTEQRSLLAALANPVYLPQLLFRGPLAMATAGLLALFLLFFFTERSDRFRGRAVRFASLWTLAWAGPTLIGAWTYRQVIPEAMIGHLPVALTTQAFEQWYQNLAGYMVAAGALIPAIALWGVITPRRLPRVAAVGPFVLAMVLFGSFERVREFIRKPDVIGGYMYANGIRREDYPLINSAGLLTCATYVPVRTVTPENRLVAGRAVFNMACTRCHTTDGVNGVVGKLTGLFGDKPWRHEAVRRYLGNIHNTRPFMPPVPGTEEEIGALADYLISLRESPAPLWGAQRAGVEIPPDST